MIGNAVVVDAVVHPFDLGPTNDLPEARDVVAALHGAHVLCTGDHHPDHVLSAEEFVSDFDHEALTHALFAESPVDLAIIHSLPNLGFTKGGLAKPERMAALRDRYPQRYLLYATVDTPMADVAIKDLEAQVNEFGVDGLKLYPSFYYDGTGHGWRMDDADFATPLLEAARDLGIRNVAVHKAVPAPPAPDECFRVEDLDAAVDRFPTLNFHIVHAGHAFLTETARLMATHSNVYGNLETTVAFLLIKPRLFGKILGTLLEAAGPDRLLFGSGANLLHPLPLLEAFAAFEMPQDLIDEFGFPPITEEAKGKILGRNALRLHGVDPAEARQRIDGDEFETLKADGLAPAWSALRR